MNCFSSYQARSTFLCTSCVTLLAIVNIKMSREEDVVVYIYNGVDEVPRDVTHVRIDPSVTVIPKMAFELCRGLEERLSFPRGLQQLNEMHS